MVVSGMNNVILNGFEFGEVKIEKVDQIKMSDQNFNWKIMMMVFLYNDVNFLNIIIIVIENMFLDNSNNVVVVECF